MTDIANIYMYILLYSGMTSIQIYCKWKNVIDRNMLNKLTVCKKKRKYV